VQQGEAYHYSLISQANEFTCYLQRAGQRCSCICREGVKQVTNTITAKPAGTPNTPAESG
jgi:hypothetical protein